MGLSGAKQALGIFPTLLALGLKSGTFVGPGGDTMGIYGKTSNDSSVGFTYYFRGFPDPCG
jgi:hypothetical protein